jgi:hypothetical protein
MTNFQTAPEAMAVTEDDNSEVLWHGPVRFERSAGKFDSNAIDLPKFLHELCSSLLLFDPHFLFRDKNGAILSMDALPATQDACELHFNYQVIEKRNVRQMLFVADMISSKTMSQLKNAAFNTLRKFGMWMFRHELDVNRLDVGTAGWILEANPRYHSPDLQRKLILQGLESWWTKLTPTVQSTWDKKLSRHNRRQSKFPDFYCNPRNVRGEYNGVSSTTTAFNIVTASEDTRVVDELLKTAFPPACDPVNGMYIPMELRRTNANHFLRLVHRQQEYLDEFQIVSVAGLTTEIMDSPMTITTANGDTHTLPVRAAFMMDLSIHRIDPGSFLLRLGKWNVSTTKTQAAEARVWVDTVIDAMPVPLRDNSKYESFPSATRMKASPTTSASAYATLAGPYSMQSLTDHQKSREKPAAPVRNRRSTFHNPQEPATPMATFTSDFITALQDSSYNGMSYAARAASPNTPRPTTGTPRGYIEPTVSPWVTDQILALQATIATIQQQPTSTITPNALTHDNPNDDTPPSPDFTLMFRQIQEGMQASRSQLSDFRNSMENRVQSMDSSIKALHKEQGRLQTAAKTFQEDVQAELRSLRYDNSQLNYRIDNLSQASTTTPVPSPRRKKPHTLSPATKNTSASTTSVSTRLDDDDCSHNYFDDSESDNEDEDDAIMAPPQPNNVTHTNMGSDTMDQEPAFPAGQN